MYIIIITCPRKAEKDHCFTTHNTLHSGQDAVPEERTAAVLAAREGQRGVGFHSCWPLRGPGWGEMHSRVGKYSFHSASQRKNSATTIQL